MKELKIIFFGSTSDSVMVLSKFLDLQLTTYPSIKLRAGNLQLVGVVTPPPQPVGRQQIVTATPVQSRAKKLHIPILNFPHHQNKPWLFADEQTVVGTLQPLKADLLISACFGQKIPLWAIQAARFGGLNLHPSLLPHWRGADPVPWAILAGDQETGVTIVTLSEKFDQGLIIAQEKYPISDSDFADPLRTKLFEIGADLLISSLPDYLSGRNKGIPQLRSNLQLTPNHPSALLGASQQPSYARRLTRDDGFVPWNLIYSAISEPQISASRQFTKFPRPHLVGESVIEKMVHEQPKVSPSILIYRAFRAFSPWPGIWTIVRAKGKKRRLKVLSCNLQPTTYPSIKLRASNLQLVSVQLEGKKPVSFKQFRDAYRL